MSVEVEQLSKKKWVNNVDQNKENKVEATLARIPKTPPLFPHRLKKKADKGRFTKFMHMLK